MPTPASEAATAHYATRTALTTAAASAAAQRWAQVDPAAIATTWARQLPATATAVGGAQLAAAQAAEPYVQEAMAAQGAPPVLEVALIASSFIGAGDGRDLFDLLRLPAITTLTTIRAGAPVDRALAVGLAQLDTIVRTEVADAGRTADQVATTTADAGGYVRLVVGRTCARCILLAGRVYEWSTGFERHPRCDCVMVPVADADAADLAQSPERIYDAMTLEQRSYAGWSKAEQQAINEGADIGQVTNIHREGSLYVAGGRQFTREGAGRRPRITPAQIYREANGDRAEAIRLLRLHRYIR